jgi:hypothetical protein
MSNKTISINPGLFSAGGSKTKKNREKKQILSIKPLISPNVLRNKLLKRIKEHKQRETENLENNKRTLSEPKETNDKINELSLYSDEFSDSINYLQTLSKQKKINNEKANYEKQKQKKREELERKTIKNYQSLNIPVSQQIVNVDLPEELRQPLISINTESFISDNKPMTINDHVPYGVLKGGTKPTYRDWNKTQRNNVVVNPNSALVIECSTLNKEKTERENRLNNLREKLKLKQLEETNKINDDMIMSQNLIQKPIVPNIIANTPEIRDINVQPNEEIIAIKKITKKTIKRKYTLGRSKIKKCVSVLVKDRGTRKKVLNAQKELKRKPINDVKTYLREHNLIKIGSNAPNDVIRKLYESSMLAGEITNSNAETLLHNFSKDDKEL